MELEQKEFIDETDILKTIESCFQSKDLHPMLVGPPGVGKSTIASIVAGGHSNLVTVCAAGLTQRDLIGRFMVENGETIWRPGFLTRAMTERDGLVLFLDEVDKFALDAFTLLMPLLDGRRKVFSTDLSAEIHAGPKFRVIAAYNPSDNGFDLMPRAFRDRWVYIEVPKLSKELEAKLLLDRYAISALQADYLIKFAEVTRAIAGQDGATTRQLEAASLATSYGVSIQQAARIAILNPICASNPALKKAIEQAIFAQGLELVEEVKNIAKPPKRQAQSRKAN